MEKIFVLIGTTGVGKTYYSKLLDEKRGIKRIKALTSRPERPTHKDEYIHVSREEFELEISGGKMLEFTLFDGHYYGKKRADVLEANPGQHAVLEMTADRIALFKKEVPNAVVICLSLQEPVIENMKKRVIDRNWSDEKISQRIKVLKKDLIEIQKIRKAGLIDHEIEAIEGDKDATLRNIEEVVDSYLVN